MSEKRKPTAAPTMSPRLAELAAETNTPQPYAVTTAIVVTPPTRTRRRGMHEAEMAMFMSRQMLAGALAAAAEPAPSAPTEPPPPAEDASDEDRAEHEAAVTALRADHDAAVAAWEARMESMQQQVKQINAQTQNAVDDYDRAFFGDAYPEVMAFFEDKPGLWERFIPDIKSEFLPKAPDDGKCPTCGTLTDEESAKKALASTT